MNDSKVISGTAMAVLLGFGAILSAIFIPSIDLGSRIVLGFLGIIMIWLGIYFSRG
jgi:spore maturation protein SpmA